MLTTGIPRTSITVINSMRVNPVCFCLHAGILIVDEQTRIKKGAKAPFQLAVTIEQFYVQVLLFIVTVAGAVAEVAAL